MSWLTRVRNSLSFGSKRETPEDLWVKCPSCNEMLFTKEYEETCPSADAASITGGSAPTPGSTSCSTTATSCCPRS